MDFTDLINRQINADQRRGFRAKFHTEEDAITQLEKDIVGLVGEVGEFANLLKKIHLKLTNENYDGPTLQEAKLELGEELADSLIYLISLATIAGLNLETELTRKMKINDARYKSLEKRTANFFCWTKHRLCKKRITG